MNKLILNAVAVAVAVVFLIGFGVYAQTTGTFKDSRDGKTYKTVKVGDKTWMAENLNFAAKGSACYENKDANCTKYGRMYNWNTAVKACPAGFHLPSDDEWTALVDYADVEKNAGKKLKSKAGWNEGGNGTDDYGWSALPGGYNSGGKLFGHAGDYGYWWSATEEDNCNARYWGGSYGFDGGEVGCVDVMDLDKSALFSVRCVQD